MLARSLPVDWHKRDCLELIAVLPHRRQRPGEVLAANQGSGRQADDHHPVLIFIPDGPQNLFDELWDLLLRHNNLTRHSGTRHY